MIFPSSLPAILTIFVKEQTRSAKRASVIRWIFVPSSTDEADAARKTVNTVPSPHIIIPTVKSTIFCRKKKRGALQASNESEGVNRFLLVTAGKALTGKEFDKAIHAYETMHRECKIDLCASMGFLSAEQLHRLHEAGVTSYHHNIETSRRNFPNICTTHTYDMKIETLKKVKAEGMCACSGGIIGMGETWEDRLDMAVSLAELGIDSIPINALMPIPGTPLEHLKELSEEDILRTIAFFRYINPDANIRLAAGRALLTNDGEKAFQAGASATITGNMLTTVACAHDPERPSDAGRSWP